MPPKQELIIAMKYEQGKQQDAEFLQWLSPSYWLVESQLSSFRQQRSEGTLQWARDMPEFQAWRLSALDPESARRITWIHGTLGIGKSIMAGYFIDLLKCHYPNAIVAYFFCRSGQPGLTTARDMLCTLAYQCIEKDKTAYAVLETLKSKGFQITDNIGIGFLFEKLLLDPLRNTPEIYIVLDGLDEADMSTQDHTDPSGIPEMHVLLQRLAKLPSTRLLFISRPIAKVSEFVENTYSKPIRPVENAEDIDSYVRKTVNKSETLKAQFKAAYKDPVQYFRDKGNGIFLWVVLVLQQLQKAKSRSVFLKYLDGFSAASGSMENLYFSILSRIDGEDRTWVKEIIRWLVVVKQPLTVSLLQHLVEWCLEDKLVDFRRFLDADCGSLLQVTLPLPLPMPLPRLSNEVKDENVRLVHETFRSFIVDREKCPPAYFIDETETHGRFALKCLQCLAQGSGAKQCIDYAATRWLDHLSEARSTRQVNDLLGAVYQLFSSDGLRLWVKKLCSTPYNVRGLHISVEIEPLRRITQWLGATRNFGESGGATDVEVKHVTAWKCAVLFNNSILGEAIGKAAAAIWLYERLDECHLLIPCFLLGLKYYWKRMDRSKSNLEELHELTASKFIGISTWEADSGRLLPIVERNMGLAFFAVYKWDECINCFNTDESLSDKNFTFHRYLGIAYMGNRDYDNAIATLEKYPERGLDLLLQVAKLKGDYDFAAKIFEEDLDRQPSSLEHLDRLRQVYVAKGDHDALAKLLECAFTNDQFEENRETWAIYIFLACTGKGKFTTALTMFQNVVDKHPKDWALHYYLGAAYHVIGDFEKAMKLLQSGLIEAPNGSTRALILGGLAALYINKRDYDGAIEALKAASEVEHSLPPGVADLFIKAYKMKGDHDRLLYWTQTIVDEYPRDSSLREIIGCEFMKERDFEAAIKVFETAAKCPAFPKHESGRYYGYLFNAYKQKGDYSEAAKLLETKMDLIVASDTLIREGVFQIYEAGEDYGAAIKAFYAIVNAPNKTGVWGWPGLLKAYAAKGDFNTAIATIQTAIDEGRIELQSETAYGILDIYKAKGDYDRAVSRFEEVVHSLPLESWPWHVLGETYNAKGDYEKTIEVYQSALQCLPFDYSFYKCLCDTYLATSDYRQVLDCYARAKELAPESFLSEYLEFQEFDLLGVYFRPEFYFRPVYETIRQRFVWYSVGEAYKRVGDYAAACDVYDCVTTQYELALKNGRNNLWAHYRFEIYPGNFGIFASKSSLSEVVLWIASGEAYRAKGDFKKSLEAFQKAVNIEPNNAWLKNTILNLETESCDSNDQNLADIAATVDAVKYGGL
jgi:tetratricopeptide (TPR) repeat protein